jgi:TIR domain
MSKPGPVSMFISYAQEDEPLRKQLEKHLSLLQRQGLVSTWQDRQITAGTHWAQEIDEHLNRASIILLLISADFLASDYCYGIEMQRALDRDKAGQARVIPTIVRPCDKKGAPFAHLQALPTDAKAITIWNNRDEAWTDVTAGIRRVIEELPPLSVKTPSAGLPPVVPPSPASSSPPLTASSGWKQPVPDQATEAGQTRGSLSSSPALPPPPESRTRANQEVLAAIRHARQPQYLV